MQSRGAVSGPSLVRLLSMIAIAAVAMMLVSGIALVSPRAAYADHESMYVVCPEPISEGDTGQMRIRRPGYKNLAVAVFTYNGDYTADGRDFTEYHGERVESEGDESSIWVPIITTEDTQAEHDETFSIGFWAHGVWHGCVVTIEDEDAPEVTHVEISSRPVDVYGYRAGESIDVTVNTDRKVEVEGTPLLSLYMGDAGESTWRGARYHSGSGSRAIVFRYTVQPEDRDTDGITVSSAAVDDDGNPSHGFSGNIYAEGTDVPIDYTHQGVDGGSNQKVDGRPYVQGIAVTSSPSDGWEAYRANQIIEIAFGFNTDVVVEGDVHVGMFVGLFDLHWRDRFREAGYLRGSGTDTLVFGYTVRPGDMDSTGIALPVGNENSGFGGDGAIMAKGADVEVNPNYSGPLRFTEHQIDTEPPAISTVSITSQPANGQAYGVGEVVSVEVAFGEKVTTDGDIHLELHVGDVDHPASLRATPGGSFSDTLVFGYTVQEGDADADGIGIGANSVKLNGGGIYDIAGNSAGLSHDAIPADADQKVATSA